MDGICVLIWGLIYILLICVFIEFEIFIVSFEAGISSGFDKVEFKCNK